MKGYFVIFVLAVVLLASCSAQKDSKEHLEDAGIPARFRRETCNSVEDSLRCDRWCRSVMHLPGGACLRNKCDCDRF